MSLLFQVYDTQSGTQLAQLSGSYTNRAVYSQSNQIHIVFTTDGSVTASGWNVTWTYSESNFAITEKTAPHIEYQHPSPKCNFLPDFLDMLYQNLFMLSLAEFANIMHCSSMRLQSV